MVLDLEVLASVGGFASAGVGLLRDRTHRRLRLRRPAWQRFVEVPKPDREHREWLVDLVARGRGSLEELEEVPRDFRGALLAVSRDLVAERRYSLVSDGWLLFGVACLAEFCAAGSSGAQGYLVAAPVGLLVAQVLYSRVKLYRRLPRRIRVLEQSLAVLQSASATGELE